MPYVQVWVDDCAGECDECEKLGAAIDDALVNLREGRLAVAINILGEAAGDPECEKRKRADEEVAKLYKDWLKLPPPRTEFLTFAHHLRKHSVV